MSFIKEKVDIDFFGNDMGSEKKIVSFQEKPTMKSTWIEHPYVQFKVFKIRRCSL
jgi:hypothetical protein